MTVSFIFGAALGGFVRFLVELWLPPTSKTAFPRATLMVNVVGSFILGIVNSAGHEARLAVGVGLCGALTTMSGVNLQVYRRLHSDAKSDAAKYLSLSVIACAASATLGVYLGALILE